MRHLYNYTGGAAEGCRPLIVEEGTIAKKAWFTEHGGFYYLRAGKGPSGGSARERPVGRSARITSWRKRQAAEAIYIRKYLGGD